MALHPPLGVLFQLWLAFSLIAIFRMSLLTSNSTDNAFAIAKIVFVAEVPMASDISGPILRRRDSNLARVDAISRAFRLHKRRIGLIRV